MAQNMQATGDSQFENVPKETVIELLKDKGREMLKLQKKLDKLQEKYVQIFKDQKLILKDREALEKTLSFLFNDEAYQFTQKQYGLYDLNELNDLCSKREDEKQKTLTNLIQQTNSEKCQLEEKYKAMTEKQIQGMDTQTQQIVKQLKASINDLEQNNTKLAKEIIELNDIIQMKNNDIVQLKKIEEEFVNYKTQLMVTELEKQFNVVQDREDILKRIKQSDSMNEQLKLQNKLESLLDSNKQLKQKTQSLEMELGRTFNCQCQQATLRQKQEAEMTFKKQSPISQGQNSIQYSEQNSALFAINDYEINPFEGEAQQTSKYQNKEIKQYSSSQVQTEDQLVNIELHQQQSNEVIDLTIVIINKKQINQDSYKVDQEYLRNVMFKYFLYQETKNYKEAQMLRHAIMTIMKMTKDEIRIIEDVRLKGGTVWQQAKSYLTDNVFCYKQGHNLNDSQIQGGMQHYPVNQLTQQMNQSLNMK